MEDWYRAGACDGFNVHVGDQPGGLEDFVDYVIPELQRRGLFRKEYSGRDPARENGPARRRQSVFPVQGRCRMKPMFATKETGVTRVSRSIFSAAAALILGGGVLGISADPSVALEKVSFSLASTIDGRSGPILLAYDRGYFKDAGIDLDIVPGNGSANVVNRLASGTFQIGSGDIASVIKFDIQNPDKRVKAIFNEKLADLVIVALKGHGITVPSDLKGKTIGAPTGDTAYKMFSAFSAATGVGADDVKWDHMDMTIREAMLVQGKVDAITASYASAFFNLKALGIPDADMVFLRYSKYGVNIVGNGWMANKSFLKEHPDTVRKMIAAFVHGWRNSIADPNAAINSVFKREPLLKRELEVPKLKDAAVALTDQPDARASGVGSYSEGTIKYTVGVLATAEKIDPKIGFSDVVDMSFLPPLAERTIPVQTMN